MQVNNNVVVNPNDLQNQKSSSKKLVYFFAPVLVLIILAFLFLGMQCSKKVSSTNASTAQVVDVQIVGDDAITLEYGEQKEIQYASGDNEGHWEIKVLNSEVPQGISINPTTGVLSLDKEAYLPYNEFGYDVEVEYILSTSVVIKEVHIDVNRKKTQVSGPEVIVLQDNVLPEYDNYTADLEDESETGLFSIYLVSLDEQNVSKDLFSIENGKIVPSAELADGTYKVVVEFVPDNLEKYAPSFFITLVEKTSSVEEIDVPEEVNVPEQENNAPSDEVEANVPEDSNNGKEGNNCKPKAPCFPLFPYYPYPPFYGWGYGYGYGWYNAPFTK